MCSKWQLVKRDVLGNGTSTTRWESMNCTVGPVTITRIGECFFGRNERGMLISQFPEDNFEAVKRTMEQCFSWDMPLKGES